MNWQLVFIFFVKFLICSAQKHDYVWTLGYGSYPGDTIHGGTNIDFSYDPPLVSYAFREMDFNFITNSMCDKEGNLIFYSNGCYVANASDQLVINGIINPGSVHDKWCDHDGYVAIQSIITLPFSSDDHNYGIFHFAKNEIKGLSNARIFPLYYSEIDISSNNGTGKLIKQNISIFSDTLGAFIKAVKHADGKSWWIIAAGRSNNIYYRIKFFDGQIEGQYLQTVEDTCKNPNGTGQAAFSPDGSMYAHFDAWSGLIIYDFDRKTGLLARKEKIDFWFDPNKDFYRGGLSFSPNGKLLYLCTSKYLYQFDITQSPIKDTRIFLDSTDGFSSPFPITFLYQELAPDGKIYISSGNSVNYWGVINNPDERGLACNFKQHSFKLATLNFWCIPNFPNYRLGPLVDAKDKIQDDYKISPNPVTHYFSYDQLDKNALLIIYDTQAHEVHRQKLSPYYHTVYISHLSPGIYFTSLNINGKRYYDKFIKM